MNCVSMDTARPDIHSVYKWRKMNAKLILVGLNEETFKTMRTTYGAIHKAKDIPLKLNHHMHTTTKF